MKNFEYRIKLKGFTLVELISILLVIAVLAVVAIPQYASFKSEAHAAKLEQLNSSLQVSAKNHHLMALLISSGGKIQNGFTYQGVYFDQGYPIAMSYGDNDGIPEILETISLDVKVAYQTQYADTTSDGKPARGLYLTNLISRAEQPSVEQIKATNCYLIYKSYVREPQQPEISIVTIGC